MAQLTVQNASLWFGEREIMSNVNFSVEDRSKIALIGVNGSGKTSLFKMITGEYLPDSGSIVTSKLTRIGYMEQLTMRGDRTVYEEALAVFEPIMALERQLDEVNARLEANYTPELIERQHRLTEEINSNGGLTYISRTRSSLIGLGFTPEQLEQPVDTLSGGQRSKVQLCKLLLSGASLLLLDEPTNHLDIAATEWLEDFLLSYSGAYIIISHDRYFLDRVTTTTMELENHRLTVFNANYSRFMELKNEHRELDIRHNENTLREMKRIQGIIEQQKRWNQARNYVTAASKQKQLDRLSSQLIDIDRLPEQISFSFPVREGGGNEVIVTDRLALSYGTKHIFSEVNIRIMKQERVFLIGANGCGKSSLIKVLASKIPGNAGSFTLGSNIDCGYFDQTLAGLHDDNTVIDEIWNQYPRMTETEVRNSLAIFLFKGDDVFKKIGNLSGGERSRVALLKLMLSRANLLLLDEPTNHLDIASREALEQALMDYEGTLFIVSHDRYFINKLADRLYFMDSRGLTEYLGNYDYYEETRPQNAEAAAVSVKPKSSQAIEYKQRKERESAARKRKTQISRTESRLEEIAIELEQLNNDIALPENASDYGKVLELTGIIDTLTTEEAELYALLEQLYDEEANDGE